MSSLVVKVKGDPNENPNMFMNGSRFSSIFSCVILHCFALDKSLVGLGLYQYI